MREIAIISKSTPAKPRSGNYNSLATSSAGAGGAAQIDFSALFAAEMARWFARDEESHAIYPVDYQEEAVGFYSKSFISAYGKNPESGGEVSGVTALSELTDVTLTDLQSGQALVWNGTRWVNRLIETGLDEVALTEYLSAHGYVTSTVLTQALGGKADKTVQVVAGDGLTGGGTLSANVTLGLAEVGEAGTYAKVTVDVYGRVTGHQSLEASDIPALEISKITGLQSALDAKLEKSVFEDLFEKVALEGGGYAIRAKYALFSNSWLSALGENPDAGGIGGSGTLEGLSDVALGALSDGQALVWSVSAGKWVNGTVSAGVTDLAGLTDLGEGWLDVLQGTKPTTLAGYGITDVYTKTEAEGRYVKKSGDTMSNSSAPQLKINGTTQSYITFTLNNTIRGHVGFIDTVGTFLQNGTNFLQIDNNGGLNYNNGTSHPLLHSGNYTTYTVTKTGGGASGTWPISITGSAKILALQDTRGVNTAPFTGGKGLHYHFKLNATDGLDDGNMYHSVLQFNQWDEQSGGLCKQLALTDAGNMWFRNASSSTAWGAWKKLLDSSNYASILDTRYVKKAGDTMTGTLKWSMNGVTSSISPDNVSYFHYRTTAQVGHWFDKSVRVQGEIYAGSGYNQKVWHAGNDGPGSGLDADLLDGYNSTSYDLSTNLGGVVDYGMYVIGLLQITDYTTFGNHARGRLIFTRDNGNNNVCTIFYNLSTRYNTTNVRFGYLKLGSGGASIVPCTFTYGGKKYAGFSMTSSSNYSNGVQVMRAGLRVREYTTPFIVRYKTSNTGAINNSEINNSLNTSMSDIQEAGVSTTTFYGSLSGNASSATKLQTARSLWGNTFDGTQNLTGRLTAAGMTCGYSNTSYAISTSGLISNGWLRTVGQCGWFSQTYGGGWYMTDSTYVRTYGSKAIHIPNSSYYSVNTTGGFYSSWNNNLPYNSTNIIKINSGILNCPELAISANNTCQPVVTWSNVVNGYGYRTRYSIASVRSSAWGSMRLSVGNSDSGTSVGAYIDIHGGGTITLGGTTHGTGGIYSDSYVSAKGNNSSDARLKTDIHGFNATSILKRLKPKAFRWNSTAWGLSDAFKTDELQYGLIAQETKNVLPGIVVDNMFNDGYMGIRYDKLIPVLLQGTLENIGRLETAEERIARLEKENRRLTRRVKDLERRLRA